MTSSKLFKDVVTLQKLASAKHLQSFRIQVNWKIDRIILVFPCIFPFRWMKSQVQTEHKMSGPLTTQPSCFYPSTVAAAHFRIGKNSTLAKKNGLEQEINVTFKTSVSVGMQALLDFTDGEKWNHERKNKRGVLSWFAMSCKNFSTWVINQLVCLKKHLVRK